MGCSHLSHLQSPIWYSGGSVLTKTAQIAFDTRPCVFGGDRAYWSVGTYVDGDLFHPLLYSYRARTRTVVFMTMDTGTALLSDQK